MKNKFEQPEPRTVGDFLTENSTLDDVEKIVEKELDIAPKDLLTLLKIGRQERKENQNNYDDSVESIVFFDYLVKRMRQEGIADEGINIFKSLVPLYKEYGKYSNQKDEVNKQKRKDFDRRFFGITDSLADVRQLDDIATVVKKASSDYESFLHDSARNMLSAGDISEDDYMDIAHFFRTAKGDIRFRLDIAMARLGKEI